MKYPLLFLVFLFAVASPVAALAVNSPTNKTYTKDPTLNITNAANDNLTYSLDGGANRTCVQLGTSCYTWNGGTLTEWVVDDIWTDNASGVESFTGWFNGIYTTTHRKEGTGAINATANTSSSTGQFRFNDSANYSFANISQVAFWIYWEANSSVSAPVEFNITRVYISGISVTNRYEIFFNNTLVPNTWTQVETAPISTWDTIGSPDITNISFVVVRFATNITTTQAGNIIIDGLKGIGKNLSTGAHNINVFNTTASNRTYFTIDPNYDPSKFDFNITVYRGWNLLTMWKNYTLINLTNLTAAPVNITVAQCWNPVNQSWAKYNWTNSSGNSSYICEKGLAAFVLIGRNDTINFTNISINEYVEDIGGNWTVNVSIYNGYNYLGVPGNVSLLNASNWTSSFRFASCWNASKQEYFTYLNRTLWVGGTHNTSVCKAGTGVVIYSLVNETVQIQREFDASGAYIAAAVLFLSGAVWLWRWRSRSGET